MNNVFFTLMLLCMLCILPFTIVFIVKAVKKKKKALWGYLALGCVVGTIVFAIIGGLLTPKCDHEYILTDEKAATCTEEGYKVYTCEKCGQDETDNLKLLVMIW